MNKLFVAPLFLASAKSALFSLLCASALVAGPQLYISSETIEAMCQELHTTITNDNFTPDLIIGIARGGLVPLGYLAGDKLFNIRNTCSISIKSYDKDKRGDLSLLLPLHVQDIAHFKSILFVDDIVDSGETFLFVTKLFKETFKDATVKTAALFYKPTRSIIKPDYYVQETDDWIVFPWE